MTTMKKIPQEKWNDLYQAAIKFRELKPWQWMTETQVFAIEHPDSGINCYCCVLGNSDDHFALSVYLGEKGLQSFLDLLTMGALLEENPEIAGSMDFNETIVNQQFLTCMFVNRDELDEISYQRIKELGFSFRGAKNWIQFRDYAPGLLPWNIEQPWQLDLLTHALQQAVIISKEEKKNSFIPEFEDDQPCPFRIADVDDNDQLVWTTEMKEIPSYEPEAKTYNGKGTTVEKVKNLPTNGTTYEFIGFYGPSPITGQSDRPFFPKILLLADTSNLSVKFNHVIEQENTDMNAITEKLLQKFLEQKEKPSKILFSNREYLALLNDFFTQLGIEVTLGEHSQRANDLYMSLCESLTNATEQGMDVEEEESTPTPQQPIVNEVKIGRNDPCPCGSGKKYKKCCL